ncbi:hypothetical protein HDU67_008444 [Dinochytrium kinnereticum]|nr:hypothetical protein HDU67_008444 [Dinochytrium kinnereticum]
MVELRFTSKIQTAIDLVFSCPPSSSNKALLAELEVYRNGGSIGSRDGEEGTSDTPKAIPHSLVSKVVRALKTSNATADITFLSLKGLVQGSQMILKSPPPREKSDKLLEILQSCQENLDRQEYDRMTADVRSDGPTIRDDTADAKRAMGAVGSVLNVLMSMAAVFVAVFYFGQNLAPDVGARTLISLLAALIVGFAEGWFLSRDLLRDDAVVSPKV